MATITKFRSTADSFTAENLSTRNFGNRPKLVLDNTGASINRSYLAFSLRSLPIDAIVGSAILRVYLRGAWSGTNTITARRITGSWRQDALNYANAPVTTATNEVTKVVTGGAAGDLVEIDVTAMVTAAVAGSTWHGIRLTNSVSGVRLLHSRETLNRALRPKLVIEYGIEPTPPTNLRPHSTHAVNAAKPLLSWDIDSQSYSWVQISTSTDFTTPEFNDGAWIQNPDPLYDMSLTGYAGVPDNAVRYWRVKHKDEDGLASDFSEPAIFERRSYGTLVIDSPATDLDPVTSSTPTILTTFTGRTLTRTDWFLERLDVGTAAYVDVVKGSIADDDFSISGVKKPSATAYKLTVQTYDEYDRGSAPGEKSYVKKVRTFTYDSGGTAAVTGLTLAQVETGSPVLVANWSSALTDTFSIYVNGSLVEVVDAADVFVSGTAYQRLIYFTLPRVQNTVTIVSTSAGVDSPQTTATITPATSAIWLLTPDDGLVLPIHGSDQISTTIGEDGETFFPLSNTPIRIVDSVRYLEGKVSGTLMGTSVRTADDARDTLLAIKDLGVSANIRLAFGRRNIKVILGEFTVEEIYTTEELYTVGFDFWQVPE